MHTQSDQVIRDDVLTLKVSPPDGSKTLEERGWKIPATATSEHDGARCYYFEPRGLTRGPGVVPVEIAPGVSVSESCWVSADEWLPGLSIEDAGTEPAPVWLLQATSKALERPIGISLADVEPEQVRWLWPGRIPRGKITVIDGDPGLGKSATTTDLGARVSKGLLLPDGASCEPGGVVLLSAEDGLADTIRPRLDAAGGDPSKVLSLATVDVGTGERPVSIPEDIPLIRQAIEQVDATLVIIGAARSGLVVAADPEDENRRVLAPTKHNLAKPAPSLLFAIETAPNGAAKAAWKGETTLKADALLRAPLLTPTRGLP